MNKVVIINQINKRDGIEAGQIYQNGSNYYLLVERYTLDRKVHFGIVELESGILANLFVEKELCEIVLASDGYVYVGKVKNLSVEVE